MLNGAYSLDYRVAGTVFLAELHFYFSVILKDFLQHCLKIFPSWLEDDSQEQGRPLLISGLCSSSIKSCIYQFTSS